MFLLQRIGRIAAILLLALALPQAALAAKVVRLSPQDQADIQRVEAYLNGITTLKARFLQISPNGAAAEGTAYMHRPGRLRLDYDPPAQVQVVADGRFLIYYDKELNQTSYLGLNDTPAGILVRAHVRLIGGDVAVVDVSRGPGAVAVTLVQVKDPGAGEITLVFTERPFELKQWRVRDPQGQVTTVSLFGIETGMQLNPRLFRFVEPSFRGPNYRDY